MKKMDTYSLTVRLLALRLFIYQKCRTLARYLEVCSSKKHRRSGICSAVSHMRAALGFISLSESPLSRLRSAELMVELSSVPSVPCKSRVESSDSTLKLKMESPARTSFMSCFVIRVASLEPPSGMVFKLVISSRSFAPALAHTAPVQSNECFLFCNFKEKN